MHSSTVRTLTFEYDLLGHLIAASDPAADYAFQVDALGNVWEETHDLAALSFDIELDRTFDWLERQTELNAWQKTHPKRPLTLGSASLESKCPVLAISVFG